MSTTDRPASSLRSPKAPMTAATRFVGGYRRAASRTRHGPYVPKDGLGQESRAGSITSLTR